MDKLKYVKLEQPDGSYSEAIPLSADGEYIEINNDTLTNRLNKTPYSYNTVADMKADTNLKVGDYVFVDNYNSEDDHKGGSYRIGNRAGRRADQIQLNNGLYANLITNGVLNTMSMPNKTHFVVESRRLEGESKSNAFPIVQNETDNETIKMQYNECELGHAHIINSNNYENKIGVNMLSPGQRFRLNSLWISGYKTGIMCPRAFYSQFNDVWVSSCDTDIVIGDASNRQNWIGVLDFNACHFNGSELAVKQEAENTNTICFDKCSFEYDKIGIENHGKIYIRNTYFGDTPDTTDKINTYVGYPKSFAKFTDSTIGITATSSIEEPERRLSIFNLQGDANNGAYVEAEKCSLNISNNNIRNALSSIYESNSDKDILYLDYCNFVPSEINNHHNNYPFYLYDNYSPLRSKNPIKNYVINGTLNNILLNSNLNYNNDGTNITGNVSFDDTLVNPFGGKCPIYIKESSDYKPSVSSFWYKIPKRLVNKTMILEVYAWTDSNYLAFWSPTLGRTNAYYMGFESSENRNNRRAPKMQRLKVTPTAETGYINFGFHWNETNLNKQYLIAGVILKEIEDEKYISCYKDVCDDYAINKPLNTTDANVGDIIYSLKPLTTQCIGWIFNGTEWIDYQPINNS